jgi:hypothetical protein
MEPKLKLSKNNANALVDATFYRCVVGSLRYLVNTKPNIAYVVGYVSRFTQEPHQDHLAPVKHILRFIAETWSYGLFYPRNRENNPTLEGYSDLAGNIDGRKSTTGMILP